MKRCVFLRACKCFCIANDVTMETKSERTHAQGQGRVAQKPVNGKQRIKVTRRVDFSFIKMFFTA